MNLDEVIAVLTEAKEHCVDGRSLVMLKNTNTSDVTYIDDIKYTSNNVIINYE